MELADYQLLIDSKHEPNGSKKVNEKKGIGEPRIQGEKSHESHVNGTTRLCAGVDVYPLRWGRPEVVRLFRSYRDLEGNPGRQERGA